MAKRTMNIFYRKGAVDGKSGYYVSTEYSDEKFFWGSLECVKIVFKNVARLYELNWIEM